MSPDRVDFEGLLLGAASLRDLRLFLGLCNVAGREVYSDSASRLGGAHNKLIASPAAILAFSLFQPLGN